MNIKDVLWRATEQKYTNFSYQLTEMGWDLTSGRGLYSSIIQLFQICKKKGYNFQQKKMHV